MSRYTRILAALAAAPLFGAGIAAAAPATSGYYVATPTAVPTKTSMITHDTVWKFRDGAFTAAKAPERDMVLCQLVAQRVGKLNAFTVGGQAFDDASLTKCNAKAQ
ncbi:MAG: hypothetical protein J0I47_14695 [Sphingomonas sp.]|uniref:CC_3452 family protein n=1 Tax=Sphingomonas sp. TaxID=28214 RepID=UPI001AC2A71B|nr:hypothetical protein [Sphingomonas sp.]MBN8809465.1 hypothetical protein [Sphingomonas sp.]